MFLLCKICSIFVYQFTAAQRLITDLLRLQEDVRGLSS
jgi:hypothetical protein